MSDTTDGRYLIGCATKYITRWRSKNGLQDLEKAKHYVQKAYEKQVLHLGGEHDEAIRRFVRDLPADDAAIITDICKGQYMKAIADIDLLIAANTVVKKVSKK